jgi:uncharacterized damage-inducible protein DinB
MNVADLLLPEFNEEMSNTRKVLERIPDDKLEWKAHPKSNTIGWVGAHLAEIPGWLAPTIEQDSWDIHPVGGEPYRTPTFGSSREILASFDANVAAAQKVLPTATNEALMKNWSLLMQGKPIFTMTRYSCIRSFMINHTVHHRAFLCSYLRLNDIPVPGMYGPSGDENP